MLFLILFSMILLVDSIDPGSCNVPNDCVNMDGRPYCVDKKCTECQSNCDCKHMADYCFGGNCFSSGILKKGSPCESLGFDEYGAFIAPVIGVNERMFCGDYIDNQIVWIGYCHRGKCDLCVPIDKIHDPWTKQFYLDNWDLTLMCVELQCVNGSLTHESQLRTYVENYVDIPIAIDIVEMILLLTICCILLLISVCLCLPDECLSKRKLA